MSVAADIILIKLVGAARKVYVEGILRNTFPFVICMDDFRAQEKVVFVE